MTSLVIIALISGGSRWRWVSLCTTWLLHAKITEQVEQQICIQFYVKLEHSSMETSQIIQKAAAMGNWWLAASSWQCVCSCIMSRAEFFGKTSNHSGDSASLQPRFDVLQLLAFPKTNSPLKGKRFQMVSAIQEDMTGQLMAIGRSMWGPKVPSLKGSEVLLSYVQFFLCLMSSSINVSIFHITWLNIFWTYLHISTKWFIRITTVLGRMISTEGSWNCDDDNDTFTAYYNYLNITAYLIRVFGL